jgi:hypothetical protein
MVHMTFHGRVLAAVGIASLAYGLVANGLDWYPVPRLVELQAAHTGKHYPMITWLCAGMMPWSVFVFVYVAVLVAVASPREELVSEADSEWLVLTPASTTKPWVGPLGLASIAYLVLFVTMPDLVDRLRIVGAMLAFGASSGLLIASVTVADAMLSPDRHEGVVESLSTESRRKETTYKVHLTDGKTFTVSPAAFLKLREGLRIALTIGRVSGHVMVLRSRS